MTSLFDQGRIASENNIPFDVSRSDEWKNGWNDHDETKQLLASLTHEQFISRVKLRNTFNLQDGVDFGWWDGVSRGNPIPFPKIVDSSTLLPHENTMAHVMAKINVFESVSEAKKNGWNKPVETGEFWAKKKTIRVHVI